MKNKQTLIFALLLSQLTCYLKSQINLPENSNIPYYELNPTKGVKDDLQFNESINKQNIYFIGEASMNKSVKMTDFVLFKHLYFNNNTKLWIMNESPVYEYYLKKYLKSGDKKYKKKILALSIVQYRKTENTFLDSLYKFYHSNLSGDFEISSNLLNPVYFEGKLAKSLLNIIKSKGEIPQNIKADIINLKRMVNNKVIIPPSIKLNKILNKLILGFSENNEDYSLYLNEDYDVFKRIVISYFMRTNSKYRLKDFTYQFMVPHLEYCKSYIFEQIKNNNSNVFYPIELPWLNLEIEEKELKSANNKYLKNKIFNDSNLKIHTISYLYIQNGQSYCHLCNPCISEEKIDYLIDNSIYNYTIFDLNNAEGYDYNYIITENY